MCKCTPSIRTPFCGQKGCEWPKPEGTLSSCPFNCGATKAPELQMSIAGAWCEHYVWCQHCGAEGPHMGKQSDAAAAWNRRALSASRRKECETCRGLGDLFTETCPYCNGTGQRKDTP